MNTLNSKSYNNEIIDSLPLNEFKKKYGTNAISIEKAATTDGYAFTFVGTVNGVTKSYSGGVARSYVPGQGFRKPVVLETIDNTGREGLILCEGGRETVETL